MFFRRRGPGRLAPERAYRRAADRGAVPLDARRTAGAGHAAVHLSQNGFLSGAARARPGPPDTGGAGSGGAGR